MAWAGLISAPAFLHVDQMIKAEKVQQAAGTSLFYGRIWDISGENAAI